MFTVKRVRVALREDGRVVALLGAKIRTGPRRWEEIRREGVTPATWERGVWLRPADFRRLD